MRIAQDDEKKTNKRIFLAPSVLFVEGQSDFQFFRFLRSREDVQIHAYGGKDKLGIELRTVQGVEGFDLVQKAIIVRDADSDPAAALQSVLDHWSNAFNRTLPKVIAEQWFSDDSGREWAVWLMPDASHPGDLEELLWRAVPESPHKDCIGSFMSCLETCQPVPYGVQTKAKLYSWLATQEEPIEELHAALNPRNELFDPSHPAFARYASLLDGL